MSLSPALLALEAAQSQIAEHLAFSYEDVDAEAREGEAEEEAGLNAEQTNGDNVIVRFSAHLTNGFWESLMDE